jgi:hypothetical protein
MTRHRAIKPLRGDQVDETENDGPAASPPIKRLRRGQVDETENDGPPPSPPKKVNQPKIVPCIECRTRKQKVWLLSMSPPTQEPHAD